METFDVVVIGAGPGGYPAAIRAAQLGASVAIVEREFPGGTCLNWGCIPTKTLIASAELFHRISKAGELGVSAPNATFDYAAMAQRKDRVVNTLRNGVAGLLKGNGVKVFNGAASFTARNRISVKGKDGETTLEARNTIIATGAESAMPGFLPKHPRVTDSRAFLDLKALPRSLIVLGGGVIGCEFACMAAQLGAKVTVVELLPEILAPVDQDVRRVLLKIMESELKIRVLTGKPLQNIQAADSGVSGTFGEEKLEADMLLAALGRKPVTAGLALEAAGVKVAKNGCIEVNDSLRTSAATVFAIGDVNGLSQLAHAATSQGITAAENACRKQDQPREKLVPACIFTSPEIGAVGMTEQEARAANRKVKIGKFMFSALGKAMAAGDTTGFVKWVTDEETGELLGAHAVGPHATELIAEAGLAIRAELTIEDVGRTIHSHPTLSESWMEAAHAAHDQCIHAPPRRKTSGV